MNSLFTKHFDMLEREGLLPMWQNAVNYSARINDGDVLAFAEAENEIKIKLEADDAKAKQYWHLVDSK